MLACRVRMGSYRKKGILISELPVGAKVVDKSWQWEHKTGFNYTGSGKVKPVVFRVVAKNHEGYPNNSVTLLSEEIIAKHMFDNSGNYGSNNWGDSGASTASKGIRKFLNGSSYIGGDNNLYPVTFYDSIGNDFKSAILETNLVNRRYNSNTDYFTKDKIFLPSQTEYGGGSYGTKVIGINYGYFSSDSSRIAQFNGNNFNYWTRSPYSSNSQAVRLVHSNSPGPAGSFGELSAYNSDFGIRPALNVGSGVRVSDTTDVDGCYIVV